MGAAESEQRVILITGTSRGIGQHLKNHYLALGDRVVGCSRSSVDAEEGYEHHELDVTDEAAVVWMVRSVAKRLSQRGGSVRRGGLDLYGRSSPKFRALNPM